MLKNGFDQVGTIFVKNNREAMNYYKEIFGMEEIYHHMAIKLKINGKFFFEIAEVSEEIYEAYMKTVSLKKSILGSWVEYETEDEVKKIYELLSTEALFVEDIKTLPWSPCSAYVTDKYGVCWYLTTPQHMPCSDCKKSTCEGDWDGKCRLNKWSVELYKKYGTDWYKYV